MQIDLDLFLELFLVYISHCSLLTLGDRRSTQPVKKTGCLSDAGDELELCTSYSSSCHHHLSVILNSNKIQIGDILVPTNPDPSGKWPLNCRETVLC